MPLLRRNSTDLAALREQLAQAISERDAAALAVEQAERARDDLDGLDREAWESAERDLASARSEAERCERAVSTAYKVCADAAEAAARVPVEAAEAKVEKLELRIAELEAELAGVRAALEPLEVELEDAEEILADARLPFIDPSSPEFKAHTQRERQHREALNWAVRHPAEDENLSTRDREWVRARRMELNREIAERHERLVERSGATMPADEIIATIRL